MEDSIETVIKYTQESIKEAISKNNTELIEAIEKLLPANYKDDDWLAGQNYILGKAIDLIKQKTNE